MPGNSLESFALFRILITGVTGIKIGGLEMLRRPRWMKRYNWKVARKSYWHMSRRYREGGGVRACSSCSDDEAGQSVPVPAVTQSLLKCWFMHNTHVRQGPLEPSLGWSENLHDDLISSLCHR